MMEQRQLKSSGSAVRQDFRFLLLKLEAASFDENGITFVKKALTGDCFWADFSDNELLRLAAVSQQHGLLDRCREQYAMLNEKFPSNTAGWVRHCGLLLLLGDRDRAVALLSRMNGRVPDARITELKNQVLTADAAGGTEDEQICAPFERMRREQDDLALFMDFFSGRRNAFARQWVDREKNKQGYVPVNRPMTEDDVQEHLAGRRTYGIYLLEEDETVRTGVIDIDLVPRLRDIRFRKKEKNSIKKELIYLLQRVRDRATEAGFEVLFEASGGKGYHIWVPVAPAVPAAQMRRCLKVLTRDLAGDCRCFSIEIFPKQDGLSGKGFGNLVKLPLGIHRLTGGKSHFIATGVSGKDKPMAILRTFSKGEPQKIAALAATLDQAEVIPHPRQSSWAKQYPQLYSLSISCMVIGQIIASLRYTKRLSIREEKVLLGVLAHLPQGSLMLHHLLNILPEYNRPLLDYKISRVRGTPIGCKRIHKLADEPVAELPCSFITNGYAHPLLHVEGYREKSCEAVSEKVTNMQDALVALKIAIEQMQRFL